LGGTNPDEVNTQRKISPKIFGKLTLLGLVIRAWIGQPQVLYSDDWCEKAGGQFPGMRGVVNFPE